MNDVPYACTGDAPASSDEPPQSSSDEAVAPTPAVDAAIADEKGKHVAFELHVFVAYQHMCLTKHLMLTRLFTNACALRLCSLHCSGSRSGHRIPTGPDHHYYCGHPPPDDHGPPAGASVQLELPGTRCSCSVKREGLPIAVLLEKCTYCERS